MIDPIFQAVYDRLMEQRGFTCSGCWEFTGFCAPNGYGQIYFDGRTWPAHRLMHTICNGPIPDGLFVLHSCDNPPCINPDHLRAGTSRENTMDSVLRGRHCMSNGKAFDTRGSAVPWECVNGHEMKGENVYITPHGRRECRACRRAARAKFVAKRHNSQSSGDEKHG